MSQAVTRISLQNFRERLSGCIEVIRQTGQPLVVTYHGSPVVRVEPYTERPAWRVVPADDEDPLEELDA